MKHADQQALDILEPLLADLRQVADLRERSRGTFYRGSKAFLHFHDDPTGLFADVRFADDFDRVRVTMADEQRALLERVRQSIQ